MAEVLYPCGYDGSDVDTRVDEFVPLDELLRRKFVGYGHPEFVRRIEAALRASNGLVGIGTGWRSSAVQETVFRQRHTQVPSGGCCSWNGSRWALKPGMAHAAPPGSSFHETQAWTSGLSGCQAIDLVGHDDKGAQSHAVAQRWMRDFGPTFGLMTAWNWAGNVEPWHVQMIELPRGVSTWKAEGRPNPKTWPLPADPTEPSQPPEDDWIMKPDHARLVDTRTNGKRLAPRAELVVDAGEGTQALVKVSAVSPSGRGWLSVDGGKTTVVDFEAGSYVTSGTDYVGLFDGNFVITAGPAAVDVIVDRQGLG